jgi:replicative DNA helicase
LSVTRAPRRQPDETQGLVEEIAMLRELIRVVHALAESESSPEELLKILDRVSAASNRLASMLNTDLKLKAGLETFDALNRSLARMLEKMQQEQAGEKYPD